MARFDLSDVEWAIISPLLLKKPRGVLRTDDRRVLNGIFYILRTGSPCRSATTHTQRCAIALTDGRTRAFGSMLSGPCPSTPRNPWPSLTARSSAPTSTLQAEKGGPDHAIGLSRGGLSTKLDAIVDEHGVPIRLGLSQGQASDKGVGAELIGRLTRTRHVVADRGYDARALVERIEALGATASIATQKDRKVQRSLARNYLAAFALASAALWTRAYESTT